MVAVHNLTGKSVVITGATSGIGLASAVALAQAGAMLIGVGRAPERCTAARQAILAACPTAQVEFFIADLVSQEQVHRLTVDIRNVLLNRGINHLDVLVNNAGAFFSSYRRTPDGVESTLAVNHLAPFLLTHQLLPLLAGSGGSRVIAVSSGSHYMAKMNVDRLNHPRLYFGLTAYAQSKLANVLFTCELNRRLLVACGVHAFAVDPGLVRTDIGAKDTGSLFSWAWRQQSRRGVSPDIPAQTILYLASSTEALSSTEPYWHNLRPLAPSREALRQDLALQLWNMSSQWCSLSPNWDSMV